MTAEATHAARAPSASATTAAASTSAHPSDTMAAPHAALFTDPAAERRTVELPLPGFEPAHLVLPRGDGARPAKLAVIAHGATERPEPHCAFYAARLGDDTLVACTRGFPNNRHLPEPERGYFYDGHPRVAAELGALFEALAKEAPFAGNVALERALFAGFSQGATMGVLALHEHVELAARFESLLLVDGGSGDWTVALARRMAERNTRVAIVCGNATCREKAERSRSWLRHASLESAFVLGTARHELGGKLGELIESALPWLLRREGASPP